MRTFQNGEPIFQAGELASHFYVVAKGAVQLTSNPSEGKASVLNVFHPTDCFAAASALHVGRYPVSAVCYANHSKIIEIETARFKELLHRDPDLAEGVISGLSERLFTLVHRIEEMTGDAATRVARHLLAMPTLGTEDTLTIELDGSKRDLAEWLGITPETLSRVFRRWKDVNLVEVKGRRITILDVDTLEAEARGQHGQVV